jgi:hypothetical protein
MAVAFFIVLLQVLHLGAEKNHKTPQWREASAEIPYQDI